MTDLISGVKLPKRKYKVRLMNTARKVAIEKGWQYYTGSKCKRGHSGTRLVKDGQCVDCRSILRAKHNDKNRARARRWELKKNFGITEEEYKKLHWLQNGLCCICKKPEKATHYKSGKLKLLAVDHCHKTNKIRGLLCYTCNVGIGLFKHDPTVLRNAALYCEVT